MTIVYCFIIAVGLQVFIAVVGMFIFQIQALRKIPATTYVLLCALNALSAVSVSIFFAGFNKKLSGFNSCCIIVLLVTIFATFFQLTSFSTAPMWYGYVFPTLGYMNLLLSGSYFGLTVKQIFTSAFGLEVVSVIAESVILCVLGVLLDQILPHNGFVSSLFKRRHQRRKSETPADTRVEKRKFRLEDVSGVNLQIRDETADDADCIKSNLYLNQIPPFTDVLTVRDEACVMDERRMDKDVIKERAKMANGVSVSRTPIIVSNLQKKFGSFLALRDLTFHIQNQ